MLRSMSLRSIIGQALAVADTDFGRAPPAALERLSFFELALD